MRVSAARTLCCLFGVLFAFGVPVHAAVSTWTGELAVPRGDPKAVRLQDGRVLIVGGATDRSPVTELFDPETATFSVTGDAVEGRWGDFSLTLLEDGRVLAVGGAYTLGRAELYDPTSGTWRATAPAPRLRRAHDAVLLGDGTVLVAGGWYSGAGTPQPRLLNADRFDPASETWTDAGGDAWSDALVALPDGRALLVGAAIFDPWSGSWTTTAPLEIGASGGRATAVLADGRVLAAGGLDCASAGSLPAVCTPHASSHVYDAALDTWTEVARMGLVRDGGSLALLPDGRALIVGGFVWANRPTAQSEAFDATAASWTAAPSLRVERLTPSATALADGRVLIVGGAAEPNATTAELVSMDCADPDIDVDDDGASCALDCDDADALRFPGSVDVCDGLDRDCVLTVPVGDADRDSDGATECGGDCADEDGGRFPDAPEYCDGIDSNCDGIFDDDVLVDDDGDGVACDDCDDTNPDRYPGAPETCEGEDLDCDPYNQADDDGDGQRVCAGDCDDNNPAVFRGAVEECNNSVDDDCDPTTDGCSEDGEGEGEEDGEGEGEDRDEEPAGGCSCGETPPLPALVALAVWLLRRRPATRDRAQSDPSPRR